MSYEKDKLDSYVTSASLTTALATYITSNSVSIAIAGINLAPYMTSNSLSAALATDTLTVRGSAAVSATLSAAAVTVASFPVGAVLLGTSSGANRVGFSFSGSWSDMAALELQMFTVNATGSFPVTIQNSASAILSLAWAGGLAGGFNCFFSVKMMGGAGEAHKMIHSYIDAGTGGGFTDPTATANTSFVNHVRVSITGTASYAFAALYGWRKV